MAIGVPVLRPYLNPLAVSWQETVSSFVLSIFLIPIHKRQWRILYWKQRPCQTSDLQKNLNNNIVNKIDRKTPYSPLKLSRNSDDCILTTRCIPCVCNLVALPPRVCSPKDFVYGYKPVDRTLQSTVPRVAWETMWPPTDGISVFFGKGLLRLIEACIRYAFCLYFPFQKYL